MMMIATITVRPIQSIHRWTTSGIVPTVVTGRRNHIVVQITCFTTKFIVILCKILLQIVRIQINIHAIGHFC